ncbi:MAG: beta-propeller fold lactonase family protein [Myxococcales bacterium]|nr:beta-propeller fold lactonase family protein [Myxococcales bacterium]
MMFRGVGRALAKLFGVAALLTAGRAAAHPPRIEVQGVASTGSMPKGVCLSPDAKRAYVSNFGQANGQNISIYNAESLSQLGVIHVPGNVVETVLSADGKTLFASNFIRNSVMFIDVENRRVAREVKTGAHPKILALSSDGKSLFAANWSGNSVTQVDVSTGQTVRTLPAGTNPRGMVWARSGTLYAANFNGASIDVFGGAELGVRHRFDACPIPRHLALSPDEKLLYVSCYHDSMVHAVDVATERVVHTVHVGSSPKSLEASRDGKWIWSADYGKETHSVSVIDTSDWTARVYPVPGMDHGSGIAVFPDGKRALVTGWYDNHVYLVGFEGTGGDPAKALSKIDGWIHRRKHD